MNTVEFVKLTTDTNYVPVKYAVIEATIGSAASGSNVWLKCVGQGVATKDDYTAIKGAIEGFQGPDKTKIIGSLGTYLVTSIDKIATYYSPVHYSDAGLLLG